MRKNHYRLAPIPKGEDTPCKSLCDFYWDCKGCSGNCKLIRRWKYIPMSYNWVDGRGIEHNIEYDQIVGYIYRRRRKYELRKRDE